MYIHKIWYIFIYIKYDIHINTIILSCKSIKQYRHTDTTPFIQKTNTAKNNRVYDDFNYMHPISKLENIFDFENAKKKKEKKEPKKRNLNLVFYLLFILYILYIIIIIIN